MATEDVELSAKAWVPPRHGRWTEREARLMRDALEQSGDSVRGFALRHGLKEHTVRNWLMRLRREARPAVFVPVKLKAAPLELMPEPLELVLRGGHTVRLGRDFDVELLRRLLAALEGDASC